MTNLSEGARTCMVALALERRKPGVGHVTGREPLGTGRTRNLPREGGYAMLAARHALDD